MDTPPCDKMEEQNAPLLEPTADAPAPMPNRNSKPHLNLSAEVEAFDRARFKDAFANYLRLVREGKLTLQDADRNCRGWLLIHMTPPWPEWRIRLEMKVVAMDDVAVNGPFEIPTSIESPKKYEPPTPSKKEPSEPILPHQTSVCDFSKYAGLSTAAEIEEQEAERKAEAEARLAATEDLASLSGMRTGTYPMVGDHKVCLLRIGDRLPEHDDDEDSESDEESEMRAMDRRLLEVRAAAEKSRAMADFLDSAVGGCCHIAGGMGRGHEKHFYILMAFKAEVDDAAIDSLLAAAESWDGADVVSNIDTIGRRKLSFAQIRSSAFDDEENSPHDGESDGDWIVRIAASKDRVDLAASKLAACRGNAVIASKLGTRHFMSGSEEVSFLVEGLIPYGGITLLVGDRKVGKTTLLTELACAVSAGAATWAGFRLRCKGRGRAIVLVVSGEDGTSILHSRLKAMDPDNAGTFFHFLDVGNAQQIKAALAEFEALDVDLLIVDPLRKYLSGSEDDSGAVSEYFETLESFARKTGAAVVTAHHPGKGRAISSLGDVILSARGSSVILDRPRVTLGLYRHSDQTTRLGIATATGGRQMHNIPQPYPMLPGECVLRFDPETLHHLPVDGLVPGAIKDASASVLAAIGRHTAAGKRVTQTGAHELWKHGGPEVAGMPRAAVRRVVEALIASGQLVIEGGCLRHG
jgi:hypothetical protein